MPGEVSRPARRSTTSGVPYLLGALAALLMALVLVVQPDFASNAVHDMARWVAGHVAGDTSSPQVSN